MRYRWAELSKQQVGLFGEYFFKMELTMYGFQVHSPEIDDRGVDYMARYESGPFISTQVKTVRGSTYVFLIKHTFNLSPYLYLALGLLTEGAEPQLFLIPSVVWNQPNELFVSYDFEDKKSKPEWGVRLAKKNIHLLNEYSFDKSVDILRKQSS